MKPEKSMENGPWRYAKGRPSCFFFLTGRQDHHPDLQDPVVLGPGHGDVQVLPHETVPDLGHAAELLQHPPGHSRRTEYICWGPG